MPILNSVSCYIQAATLRICFGLVFVGLAIAAHTAQSEESSFAHDMSILTIQPVRSGADRLLPYQFNVSVVLTRPADTTPVGAGFSNTPRLHLVTEPKKDTVWPIDAHWQATPDSDRISLSPLLRFESKGERIEIKPRRHSIWVGWRKAFP